MASNGELKVANTNNSSKKATKGNGIVGFFKGLKAEFKRMTWPPKEDIKKSTIAVLTFCIIFVVIVGLLDKGFKELFEIIFIKK
ncbi:preprotein translocase subunit SecE [Haloimpatiens sp. FM7330]|uniref:preprotein translocase subunit SecE n=1 Tax=Haloimpatiens sp. FM7330 TaxID=3298610 RepID=UPI003638E8C0